MNPPPQWARLRHLPRADLKALQDAALARYVREELYPFSAHYRRVFDSAGVRPRDIRGSADLRRLPFTTKQDLLAAQVDPERRTDFILKPTPAAIKEHWPFARKLGLVLTGERGRAALRRAYTPNFVTFTTGRSSEPVSFTYTPHDLEVLGEGIARMFDLLGVTSPEERVANLFPFAPHLAFWAVTLGGFTSGRLVVPSGGGKVMGTEGNLRLVARLKATALVGTPGFLYHMVRTAAEQQVDLSRVRTVVLGAEKSPPGLKLKLRGYLEQCGARDVRILGTYGFTESRMAFGEAPTPDGASTGYYVYPDLGVFEVVDPKSGEPVEEGADGELVYTGISGHGTTVLRYRTGDLVQGGLSWRPYPGVDCSLPRISSSIRRVSEQHALSLTKLKGTLVDLSVMGQVIGEDRDVEEWQVAITKAGDDPYGLDQLEVRVAARRGSDRDALERRLSAALLSATEVSPNAIRFLELPELLDQLGMESQPKERRFLDLRPKAE